MADNLVTNPGVGGATIATDDVGGVHYPISKLAHGGLDSATLVSTASGLPVQQQGNWSVRTQDGSGTAITSIADGAGQVGLTTAIGATNFVASAANSTSSQLTAGSTFIGTIETIFNQQAISVLLTSDQAGTLTLKQYIDAAGTRLISSWPFTIAAGVPFSRCFTGNGNYFNLTFQNTSGSTTTTLNINTAYGTLPAATNLGYLPTSINEVNGTALSLGMQAPSASLPVNLSNDVTVGAAASIAAVNADLLTGTVSGWYDAANFHSATIQIVGSSGITAGAVTFEQTNDTSAASAGNLWAVDEVTSLSTMPNVAAVTIASATTRMFGGAVTARYVRVRVSTAFATANVQAIAVFSQMPYTRPVQTIIQATPANLNVSATGQTAHSSASAGNPVRVAGRVNTAVDTTLAAGDASDLFITTSGALVEKPFSVPELDWNYAGVSGGITNTTDVVLKAAGAAGVRNYCTSISVQNASATVATEVVVKDGATVIWRGYVGTSAILNSAVSVVFPTPLRGSAATALNVACITTGAAVYVNAQGYQAP